MKHGTTRGRFVAAGLVAAAAGMAAVTTGGAAASAADQFASSSVPANPRSGVQDNQLAPGLDQTSVAYGNLPLTNPDAGFSHYGYNTSNNGPLTQNPTEAFKSEPDKNAYLILGGHHYLFQGHEGGPAGYVTRVDLDSHQVALIADRNADGTLLPTFDGITWDPFSHQLLLTAEASYPKGGVWAVGLDDKGDSTGGLAATRLPALGSGGYEGIQNDDKGNVWLVEDIGGSSPSGEKGKRPNSYVYRFKPVNAADLTAGGKLEALQVLRDGKNPATAAELQADPTDSFLTKLHTYGSSFDTSWATVNDGDGSGDPAGFNATSKAAAAGATPFKRPENGVFRPGTGFREFVFTETGDTNTLSTLPGRFGGVFRLVLPNPNAQQGTISPLFLGDLEHTGLDNLCFAAADQLLAVEDAGDTLHGQRNALDSGYLLTIGNDGTARTPLRWLAEGRDPSATYDATAHDAKAAPAYNDGDNEITGIHISDGDASTAGLLGAKSPTAFSNGWRAFWTQQHGDNVTWELLQSTAAKG